MKMTKSVLLAMLAASAQTSMASAEPAPVTRIVGGGQADIGEYPYFGEYRHSVVPFSFLSS